MHGHQKDIMSLQEIGLHAQNLVTIMLDFIVNIIGVTYHHLLRIFTLKLIRYSQHCEDTGYDLD